jgi:hypothetical protein
LPISEKGSRPWNRLAELAWKAYPSASGATKCGSERGEFVIEQMTNNLAAGGTDD